MNVILSHAPIKLNKLKGKEEDLSDLSDIDSDLEDEVFLGSDDIPISSDEEAVLESQRINISDLFGSKSLLKTANGLITPNNDSTASVQKADTIKDIKSQQAKQQQKEEVKKQIKNKRSTVKRKAKTGKKSNTKKPNTQQKKQTQKKSDTQAESLSEVDTSYVCGTICAFPKAHSLIFECKKCNNTFYDIHNFSKHLHNIHAILSADGLFTEFVMKKEIVNPECFSLGISDTKQCGDVEIVNGKKLSFSCGLCKEVKYEDYMLFYCHLEEEHTILIPVVNKFSSTQKIEIKDEVCVTLNQVTPLEEEEVNCLKDTEEVNSVKLAEETLPPMVTIPKTIDLPKDFNGTVVLPTPAPDTPPPETDDINNSRDEIAKDPITQNEQLSENIRNTKRRAKKNLEKNATNDATAKKLKIEEKCNITSSRRSGRNIGKKPNSVKSLDVPNEKPKRTVLRVRKSTNNEANLKQSTLFDMLNYSTNSTSSPAVTESEKSLDKENLPELSTNIAINLEEGEKMSLSNDNKMDVDKQPDIPNVSTERPSADVPNDLIQLPSPPESVKSFKPTVPVVSLLEKDSIKNEIDTATNVEQSTKRAYKKRRPYKKKNRLTCEFCPKTFKKTSRLNEHKRIHTGEKPYDCDICGKRFRIRFRLREHKIRHREEKAFKCEICGLASALKQDYNLHMRHHADDRRHRCTICSKAFVRSTDLKIHVRIHTGEKPFACEICGRSFRAKQNLTVHRRSHFGEKNFKCEHCDKSFLRKIDRKVHMRTHTGEKPFKCEICQRSYSSRFRVRVHIERQHMNAATEKTKDGKTKVGKPRGRKPKPKLDKEMENPNRIFAEIKQKLLDTIDNDQQITKSQQGVALVPNDTVVNSANKNLLSTDQSEQTNPKLKNVEENLSMNYTTQQVSLTLSMQVEKLPVAVMPEKENVASSLTSGNSNRRATVTSRNKRERKITTYFSVVG